MSWFIRRKNKKKRLTAADAKPFTRPPEYLRRRESTAKSKPDTRPRILVVDMAGSNRDISVSALESEGYLVNIANNGEEALSMIVKQHPDVVVTNVPLPKLSGFDMIDIIKSIPEIQDIPVIILCGLREQADIDTGNRVGAAEYLIYPEATPGDLLAAVKRVIKKSKKPSN